MLICKKYSVMSWIVFGFSLIWFSDLARDWWPADHYDWWLKKLDFWSYLLDNSSFLHARSLIIFNMLTWCGILEFCYHVLNCDLSSIFCICGKGSQTENVVSSGCVIYMHRVKWGLIANLSTNADVHPPKGQWKFKIFETAVLPHRVCLSLI